MTTKSKIIILPLLTVAALAAGLTVWNWFSSQQDPGYRFVLAWGETGSGLGQFFEPIGIAVAGDKVFVSEAGNNRIQVFD